SGLYQQLQDVYGAAGSSTGLDTLFNNFTTALQNLQSNPSSFSSQSNVLNSAQVLAQQLNSMTSSIQTLRGSAEQGISSDVQSANDALQQIATINQQVNSTSTSDTSSAALEDQRD